MARRNLPAGAHPHSQQQPSCPAQASGKIYFLLLSPSPSSFHFRASSHPLSSSNAALLTCASGMSRLFFHTFQHSVDSSQLLCLLQWYSQQEMQMQMNLSPAKTTLSLFKMVVVARQQPLDFLDCQKCLTPEKCLPAPSGRFMSSVPRGDIPL